MLNSIKLTNFQRHRSLSVTFNGGLTALRGANEAGKSTMLRGICYALFGVKVLGISLEDLVTWGEDVKTLKTELEIQVDGVVYSFKRGKSGAEVNYDGGRVTGQNEVSDFACRLLRCSDGVAATRLILANQNEIRGALSAGPAKTAELIERLAEFDQIDHLLELMDEKLTHGSTAGVESAITAAEAQLEAARAAAVAPDVNRLEHAIDKAAEEVDQADSAAGGAADRVELAKQALNDAKVAAAEREALDREVQQLDMRIGEVEGQLEDLRRVPAPDNVDIPALRQRIADAENVGRLRAQYAKVEPHIRVRSDEKFAGNEFKGTFEDLEQAIRQQRAEHQRSERATAAARTEARVLRQKISDGSCSLCGRDVSDVPEVRAKNEALDAEALQHEQVAEAEEQACSRGRTEVARLEGIRDASRSVLRVLDVVGGHARLLDGVLPPFLVWTGPDVGGEPENTAALQEQIAQAERQQRAFERASAKIETLTQERERAIATLDSSRMKLATLPVVDTEQLRAAVDSARDALRPAQEAAQAAAAQLQAAQRAKADAVTAYERAKAAVESAKVALKERRAELEALGFNNALIKRVRQCRPLIADQLWNLVLSAVSTYFSEMRGFKSRVRKTGDGFTVDGHPVATLSGSTLDILGLAIRVALVRTFLPAAPFLILDEPAAAMDDQRTSNMLGFLAGAGFKQVILVTHEDVSQAVADNMITL